MRAGPAIGFPLSEVTCAGNRTHKRVRCFSANFRAAKFVSFSINNPAALFPSSGVGTAFGRGPQSRPRTSPSAWEAQSHYSLMSVLQSGLVFIYSIVFIKFQLVIQVSCPRGRSGRGKEMGEKQKRACEIHRCMLCCAQGCKHASLGYPRA